MKWKGGSGCVLSQTSQVLCQALWLTDHTASGGVGAKVKHEALCLTGAPCIILQRMKGREEREADITGRDSSGGARAGLCCPKLNALQYKMPLARLRLFFHIVLNSAVVSKFMDSKYFSGARRRCVVH